MKRRRFLTLLTGATVAARTTARAQQPKDTAKVGFLGSNTPATAGHLASAFANRLRELGWIEGRNLAIEYRWAAGQTAKYREFAADLIASGVDVIVITSNAPAAILKRLTSSVPIVMAASADILETGLVNSLARPGGNITGLTFAPDDFVGKRIELLKETVPRLERVAVVFNPDAGRNELGVLTDAAPTLRISLEEFEFRTAGDLDRIAAFSRRAGIGGLFVRSDPLVFVNRSAINAIAIREKLPTVHRLREYVEDGGLISYGPDFVAFFRRSADYVDKVLRGTRPEDLPIEQPTLFHLAINLRTAKAIDLAVPSTVLSRADEVIE
jgi:putative tryptophan/tyrosine transport system substrate-binding protein